MTATVFDDGPLDSDDRVPPRVDVERLSKRYGTRWVLTGVSFTLEAGEGLLVAGPNGAGKSTLLGILATSLPFEAGRLRIGEHPIPLETRAARHTIAYAAHQSLGWGSLSALENLEVWRSHLGLSLEPGELGEILYRVGLSRAGSTTLEKFSAGMKRRLSLGRVLLQLREPSRQLVILDEPYEQLDREGFDLVGEIIEESRANGAAVVVATHLIERAAGRASRAIYLDDGVVRFAGSPAELIRYSGERNT